MKAAKFLVLPATLTIAGCCTSVYQPETVRIDGQEWGDTSMCGIFSGWGTREQPERSKALYTPVTVAEYTRYLCEPVAIEDFATCANRVEQFYREARQPYIQLGDAQSGPFAILLEDKLYIGSYRSDVFSASFRVSYGGNTCKGSYNAIQGDKEAVFRVWCDDGKRGKARIVLDRYGRDGIGVVMMDDGVEGRIVYGPTIAEVARSAL